MGTWCFFKVESWFLGVLLYWEGEFPDCHIQQLVGPIDFEEIVIVLCNRSELDLFLSIAIILLLNVSSNRKRVIWMNPI